MNRLPSNIEAEQAVIGAVMLAGKDALDRVSDIVQEEDFFRHDHQLIWRAILALGSRSRRFDPVTLGDWLQRKGKGDEVEGAYLVEIATTTPSAAAVKAYAEIVRDMAILRRVVQLGSDIQNLGLDPDGASPVEVIGKAQTMAGALLQHQPSEVSPMSLAVDRAFSELAERHAIYEAGGKPTLDGITTGFDEYDEILGGLTPGMHVLAGRSKHGKSTLAQNIAEHVALRLKKPVHIVILEMTEEQYGKRVMASVGGVDSQRMRRGTLDDADWHGLSSAVRRLKGAPFFISKPGTTRIEAICAQIRKQHAQTPLGLAVLDYLGLVDVRVEKGENYATAVGRVTRALVNLTQELKIPLLCLVQLNRDAEKERPKPHHLKDSGSIEADAESVTFVYREDVSDPKSRYAGTVEVIVALNRNGPPGSCRLLFNGAKYRCEPLPPDWVSEQPERKPKENNFKPKPVGSKVLREIQA